MNKTSINHVTHTVAWTSALYSRQATGHLFLPWRTSQIRQTWTQPFQGPQFSRQPSMHQIFHATGRCDMGKHM